MKPGLVAGFNRCDPGEVLFTDGRDSVTAAEIRARLTSLRSRISARPGAVHLITECASNAFVGLLAGIAENRDIVLPAHAAPDYLHDIAGADGIILRDRECQADAPAQNIDPLPEDRDISVAFFTSGTTGEPKRVTKQLSWLETEGKLLADLWDLPAGPVQATVSHQHIYGLLFRIVMPMLSGRVSADLPARYWEDLTDGLSAGSILVTSPAHLTRMGETVPWQDMCPTVVFSSGAPLPLSASVDAERHLGARPIEVFGSTETGGIAWRQQWTAETPWTPFPGVAVDIDQGGLLAVRSPYAEPGTVLTTGDRAKIGNGGCFRLLGRADRVVKIEGKRVSLTHVEAALTALASIDAVAAVDLPDRGGSLGAVVVLDADGRRQLADHGAFRLSRHFRIQLRPRLEPMERPKFWRFVDALPVTAQGKVDPKSVRRLFAAETEKLPQYQIVGKDELNLTLEFTLSDDLIWLDGHFPKLPILPGVAQIHMATLAAEKAWGWHPAAAHLNRVKFRSVIRPDDQVQLRLQRDLTKDRLHFAYRVNGKLASDGHIG